MTTQCLKEYSANLKFREFHIKIQISETSLKLWRFGEALFTCAHGNILEEAAAWSRKGYGQWGQTAKIYLMSS